MASPVPPKMFTKLRYADQQTITFGSAATISDYIFVANGLYDPNHTGTGHQPRGFDEIMALYDHYTVLGSKITCTFTNASSTTAGTPINVAVVLADDNTAITSYNDMQEQGRVRSRVIAHPEGGRASTVISKGFSAKKFLGRTNVLDNDDLKGSTVSNPLEGAFFHLLTAVPALVTDRTVHLDVVIDFIVAFTEPSQPNES